MSAKTIAIAIILAGTAGAAAGYFQRNPDTMQTLWQQATVMRGPMAGSDSASEPGTSGQDYRYCRAEFADILKRKSQSERAAACACFEKEIGRFDPAQKALAVQITHTAFSIAIWQERRKLEEAVKNPGNVSASQRLHDLSSEVQVAKADFKKHEKLGLSPRKMKEMGESPISSTLLARRVKSMIERCDIVDFESIGEFELKP